MLNILCNQLILICERFVRVVLLLLRQEKQRHKIVFSLVIIFYILINSFRDLLLIISVLLLNVFSYFFDMSSFLTLFSSINYISYFLVNFFYVL